MGLRSHKMNIGLTNLRNVFFISVAGLVFDIQSIAAAEDCYFDNAGKTYCHYGCCDDKCCPLATAAVIGLIAGAILGLAALVGCLVCMTCMFKQQTASAVVHPVQRNNRNIYIPKKTDNYLIYAGGAQPNSTSHKDGNSPPAYFASAYDISDINSKPPRYEFGNHREKY